MTESVTVNKKRIKQITQTQEDILTAFGQLLANFWKSIPMRKFRLAKLPRNLAMLEGPFTDTLTVEMTYLPFSSKD